VKHLEYEQEKTNKEIDLDGDTAKSRENDNFNGRTEDLKKNKSHLKKLYEENEDANIHTVMKIISLLFYRSRRKKKMIKKP